MISKPEEKMRVRYASAWLRNTGQYTGPVPFMRGEIVEVGGAMGTNSTYVKVLWDGEEEPQGVPSCNLERVRGAKP